MKRKNTSTDILREFRELTKLVSEAADLSSSEMTKRPGRWEIFRSKMENGDPFILKTKKGDVSVTIPTESDKSASNEDLYNAVIENDPKAYKRAFSLGVVAFDSSSSTLLGSLTIYFSFKALKILVRMRSCNSPPATAVELLLFDELLVL